MTAAQLVVRGHDYDQDPSGGFDHAELRAITFTVADFIVTGDPRRDARPGHCRFCDRQLRDTRSLAAGAGRTCARTQGAPYPGHRPCEDRRLRPRPAAD